MKEITVAAWDDLDFAHDGKRVPADPLGHTVLVFDGTTYELDLTAEHRSWLENDLARWLKAATRQDAMTHRSASPRERQPIHPAGMSPLQAARVYNRAMHEWALQVDPRGERYKITKGTGKFKGTYWPENLKADYAAHLAREAGSAPG